MQDLRRGRAICCLLYFSFRAGFKEEFVCGFSIGYQTTSHNEFFFFVIRLPKPSYDTTTYDAAYQNHHGRLDVSFVFLYQDFALGLVSSGSIWIWLMMERHLRRNMWAFLGSLEILGPGNLSTLNVGIEEPVGCACVLTTLPHRRFRKDGKPTLAVRIGLIFALTLIHLPGHTLFLDLSVAFPASRSNHPHSPRRICQWACIGNGL